MNTAPHLTTCLCVDADRKVKSNRFSISRKFSQKGSGDILRKRILPSNGNNPVVAVPGNAPRSIRGGVSWKAQFVAISSTRLAWDLQSGGLQSGSLRSPANDFGAEAALPHIPHIPHIRSKFKLGCLAAAPGCCLAGGCCWLAIIFI